MKRPTCSSASFTKRKRKKKSESVDDYFQASFCGFPALFAIKYQNVLKPLLFNILPLASPPQNLFGSAYSKLHFLRSSSFFSSSMSLTCLVFHLCTSPSSSYLPHFYPAQRSVNTLPIFLPLSTAALKVQVTQTNRKKVSMQHFFAIFVLLTTRLSRPAKPQKASGSQCWPPVPFPVPALLRAASSLLSLHASVSRACVTLRGPAI